MTHKPICSITNDVIPQSVRVAEDDTVLPVPRIVRLSPQPGLVCAQGGAVSPGEVALHEEVLQSNPGGAAGGAHQAEHEVLLGLGLYLGQAAALGYAGLQGLQPVCGALEQIEALGAGDCPAGGAGGGGHALEGVGGAAGDRSAGVEGEEAAGESALG